MQNFNYSMKLRFDVRFVIYFPKLVELDSFKPYLFIFDADLLLVTCQNLASMLIGRVFLSVCLLLAKIYILASMFVGRVCLSVCYLPKFTFWQVCSLVVFVCLFVCMEISQKNDSFR